MINKIMKTKICSKCKKRKKLNKFGIDKNRKNKLTYKCKLCRNEWIRNHQRKPEIKAKRREYEIKNKKRITERNKNWVKRYYKKYPEKMEKKRKQARKLSKIYYEKNKEKVKKYRKRYYQENKR